MDENLQKQFETAYLLRILSYFQINIGPYSIGEKDCHICETFLKWMD